MPRHASRLTGTRTEPRWPGGERTRSQADAQASGTGNETDRLMHCAMEASLHLHTALPHIADAGASEHAQAAVIALDDMIKALRHRNLPSG